MADVVACGAPAGGPVPATSSGARGDLPRVLAVSAPLISLDGGYGLTYARLLARWPPGQLAQIHADAVARRPLCAHTLALGRGDVLLDGVVRPFVSSALTANRSTGATTGPTQAPAGPPDRPSRAAATLRAWADVVPYRISDDLVSWARRFRPDIVFATLGSIRFVTLAADLAARLDVPVVADFRDDFPAAIHGTAVLGAVPRAILRARLRRLGRRTVAVTAGSADLARLYGSRLGVPGVGFVPALEDDELADAQVRPPADDARPARFAYVGGLHLGRWRELVAVGSAVAACNERHGTRATLTVFAPAAHLERHAPALRAVPAIEIGGHMAESQIVRALRDYDVLVHVESFDREARTFTRYSISTKIPRYMAAGRAILAFGPGELTSIRYLAQLGCALVVDAEDRSRLDEAVGRLARDPVLRGSLAEHGREAAIQRHAARDECDRFERVLTWARQRAPRPPLDCADSGA